MKKIICGLTFAILCLVKAVYATSNPVSSTLLPVSGFGTTQIGNQSSIIYTLTNHLPFQVPITTTYKTTGQGFSIADNCLNQVLMPGGTCQIIITFTPLNPGTSTIQLIYGYHNNRIPLPALRARATKNPVPPKTHVKGTIFGLPSETTLSPLQTPDFTATYTNTSAIPVVGYAGDQTGNNLFSVSPNTRAIVSILNNTCGTAAAPTTLAPNQSCLVEGKLTPLDLGTARVTGLFVYGAKTSLPTAHTLILQGGSSACVANGHVELPLPSVTYRYADNVVKFVFENDCATLSTTLGQVAIAATFTPNSGQTATITTSPLYDTCSGKTLAPQNDCYVLASVIPQNPATTMKVTARVPSGGSTATASTSAQVKGNVLTTHYIHFVNQCPFNVWYGIANGTGANSPDPNPNLPAPASAYFLAAQVPGQAPSTIDLTAASYVNGAIWARTGCASDGTNFACETGMCNTLTSTSGTCVQQGGSRDQPVPPFTKYEFTLSAAPGSDGVYDVSLINGFNVPVQIKGLGPTTPANPFQCTGAGAVLQPTGSPLGSCSWQFNPAFSNLSPYDFVWVSAGPDTACNSNADCTNGNVCGMAFSSVPSNAPINRRCGQFLGYSTLANYFGYPSAGQWGSTNLYAKYNIGIPMSAISSKDYGFNGANPAIFGNLLACIPTSNLSADTCYNPASNLPTCCGCVNWDAPSSPVRTASSSPCLNVNNDWTTTTGTTATPLNAILWLKNACPTAYAYQFDDPSSSFACNISPTGFTNYQVTFCPGGINSLPPGASDGRLSL
ncbi:Thaumatin domain-containing protein [Legionella beliardensis]|uniref:Thaumatin domain-containing protein n=1 Tax=Legionella beliardensis TaxID=91822 RepID=A0A378HXQ1_9GAMM|nr:thaumatin family protein [Legionella beliardensis]STX27677.1 Thaumatin domain-containing protein [Legionella beliardensis]